MPVRVVGSFYYFFVYCGDITLLACGLSTPFWIFGRKMRKQIVENGRELSQRSTLFHEENCASEYRLLFFCLAHYFEFRFSFRDTLEL